jgi:hypothetical protein
MSSISTSPYENQEETAPIVIKTPPATKENALTAFRFGRRTARDTLDVLVELHAFEPPLLTGVLLAMSYGEEMLRLREIVHDAPPAFRDFFCRAIEAAVNAEDITSEGGRLFLALFDGEPVE